MMLMCERDVGVVGRHGGGWLQCPGRAEGATRRSKSEGPHAQTCPTSSTTSAPRLLRSDSDPSHFLVIANGEEKSSNQGGKESVNKMSEYRVQFAWPGTICQEISTPIAKKSHSMGAIKSNNSNQSNSDIQPTPVHKKENVDPKKHNVPPPPTTNPEPLVNGDLPTLLKKEELPKGDSTQKDEYLRPVFSETWFREVLELRKKAGEYKHRGWGTELVPEHIAELYNKQISLWEHVARRSSLEALSLASSAHKKGTKEENDLASGKKANTSRALWVELEGGKNEVNKNKMENFLRYNFERTALSAGRTQTSSNEQRNEYKSPKKSARAHSGHGKSGPSSIEKNQRPTCLPTALTEAKPQSNATKENEGRNKQAALKNRLNEQSPSNSILISNKRYKPSSSSACGPEIFKHIVKSPPEPTRVKSPEQIILRSPEPVNWTVPLDTGKTFTVTQNVSEVSRNFNYIDCLDHAAKKLLLPKNVIIK